MIFHTQFVTCSILSGEDYYLKQKLQNFMSFSRLFLWRLYLVNPCEKAIIMVDYYFSCNIVLTGSTSSLALEGPYLLTDILFKILNYKSVEKKFFSKTQIIKWTFDTINPYNFSAHFVGHYANSADPYQMPQNAASNQGLHCLLTECFIKIWIEMNNTHQTLKRRWTGWLNWC